VDLGLDVSEQNGYSVLAVSGEVDVATVPRLREQLHGLVAQGSNKIVVDLDSVDFLDSTGLGVLVGALKRVRSNDGELSLVCTQPRIRKVFEVTGLTKVFNLYDSVDEAVSGSGS
jgi:anti-sigma B factor antagonist